MTDNDTIQELQRRVEQLEEQQQKLVQGAVDAQGRNWSVSDFLNLGLSRRQALTAVAAIASGATIGGALREAVGVASAAASTSDSDGDVGTPSNRVDVFADGVDAVSVENNGTPFEAAHGMDIPEGQRIRNASENTTEQFVQIQNEELVDGGNAQVIPNLGKDSMLGTAIINCDTADANGIVAFGGGGETAYILVDPNGRFTTTEGNLGSVNVYYDSNNGQYEINNELGSTQDLRIYYFN